MVSCVSIAVATSPVHLRAQAGNHSSHVAYIGGSKVNSCGELGTGEATQFSTVHVCLCWFFGPVVLCCIFCLLYLQAHFYIIHSVNPAFVGAFSVCIYIYIYIYMYIYNLNAYAMADLIFCTITLEMPSNSLKWLFCCCSIATTTLYICTQYTLPR